MSQNATFSQQAEPWTISFYLFCNLLWSCSAERYFVRSMIIFSHASQQNMSRLITKPTQWQCVQRRFRSAWASAQSDQSHRCALNGKLRTQAFFMRTAKTLIRLGGCPGWSESSLGAQSFCWFCHEAAHISSSQLSCGVIYSYVIITYLSFNLLSFLKDLSLKNGKIYRKIRTYTNWCRIMFLCDRVIKPRCGQNGEYCKPWSDLGRPVCPNS